MPLSNNQNSVKKTYQKPQLSVYGDIRCLTQAGNSNQIPDNFSPGLKTAIGM
ncbi:hypothetical protein PJF56_18705 [Roseofilum sp. BLCC_M91]|uniref:Lasso RiPP family leader peptide-containing protein n=1 Tax=Roseofilum halophilum BLCC-M91 TaxID=3022259 RepID=A0ABT7BNY6_9CYAN|nr:hypothetical protein [Roseofilum halophilum]MDJ1180895.1 hypothetical protein [Roseofilum halophilum BLCC-M91]